MSLNFGEKVLYYDKICGVDMTKKEPVEDALCIFEDYLAQLEALMGETK